MLGRGGYPGDIGRSVGIYRYKVVVVGGCQAPPSQYRDFCTYYSHL